jgi:competence protein ComGF
MKANPERIFMHRLARELGYTISRLLAETDSRDIAEWMAFFSLEAEDLEEKKHPNKEVVAKNLKATLEAFSYGGDRSRKSSNKSSSGRRPNIKRPGKDKRPGL